MKHASVWLLAIALAVAPKIIGAECPSCEQDNPAGRPNIIFIFTDDHASHAISAYGSKLNKTPHLDRLAKEGMLFENCFCTNSICAPSRAVILTGKHSHINGVIDNRATFNGKQQTFPKILRKAGYQTAMIGKWHLKSEPTGFDFWTVLRGQGPYYNPIFRTAKGPDKRIGYTTEIITDVALEWLKNGRDKSKPFMMMYQHKAPHREWAPGPKYLNMYDDVTIPEPPTLFDDYANRTSAAKKQEMTIVRHMSPRDLKLVPPRNLTKEQLEKWNAAYGPKNEKFKKANLKGKELVRWKYQRYIKDYLRCIAAVDDNVGRLLKYLDDTGLAKNTVVIYSSDQGFYLGDHGWYDKRWMYEESLRMPLMVRWPGVTKPGSRSTDLVQNLDFAETFLDIAGAEIPEDMQGRSLVPLLKGEVPEDWRKSIYYHYYEFPAVHMVQRHYGVRTKTHKLIHYYLIDEWELFDLEKDPDELKSVYDDPKNAELVKELKGEIKRLRKKYKVDDFKEPRYKPRKRRNPKQIPLSLALQYRFSAEKNKILDTSGNGVHAQHNGIVLVKGRNGEALRLTGKNPVRLTPPAGKLDPSYAPLTVGGWCRPANGTGAIVAQGGESLGYCLYLKDRIPHFVVTSSGTRYVAKADSPVSLEEWTHLAGQVDVNGRATVLVNGKATGKSVKTPFITGKPADGISIGADTGSHVGHYETDMPWTGLLEDVRIYWGQLNDATLSKWLR